MGPVEFSTTGADAPSLSTSDDLDFGPMDHSISACKTESAKAGAGRCTQVRAYEACMKTRGYILDADASEAEKDDIHWRVDAVRR